MPRAKVPQDAPILVEVGSQRPDEVAFDPFESFEMLWVVTNGRERRQLLWVCARKSGIYVAYGGPGRIHSSYHSDGAFSFNIAGDKVPLEGHSPLRDIQKPDRGQSATIVDQ